MTSCTQSRTCSVTAADSSDGGRTEALLLDPGTLMCHSASGTRTFSNIHHFRASWKLGDLSKSSVQFPYVALAVGWITVQNPYRRVRCNIEEQTTVQY